MRGTPWTATGTATGQTRLMTAVRATLEHGPDFTPARVRRGDHVWLVLGVVEHWAHPGSVRETYGSAELVERYVLRVWGPLPQKPAARGEFAMTAERFGDRAGWWIGPQLQRRKRGHRDSRERHDFPVAGPADRSTIRGLVVNCGVAAQPVVQPAAAPGAEPLGDDSLGGVHVPGYRVHVGEVVSGQGEQRFYAACGQWVVVHPGIIPP